MLPVYTVDSAHVRTHSYTPEKNKQNRKVIVCDSDRGIVVEASPSVLNTNKNEKDAHTATDTDTESNRQISDIDMKDT